MIGIRGDGVAESVCVEFRLLENLGSLRTN